MSGTLTDYATEASAGPSSLILIVAYHSYKGEAQFESEPKQIISCSSIIYLEKLVHFSIQYYKLQKLRCVE